MDVTVLLRAVEQGEPGAMDRLIGLVYGDLQRMARHQMANEAAGITLDSTCLVHEAYLRLFSSNDEKQVRWENRRHFFGAAATAMRRILIEHARKRHRIKRGGHAQRVELDQPIDTQMDPQWLIELDDCLDRLQQEDPEAFDVARLRLYAGLSIDATAEVLGLSRATAYRHWAYARAWLQATMSTQ